MALDVQLMYQLVCLDPILCGLPLIQHIFQQHSAAEKTAFRQCIRGCHVFIWLSCWSDHRCAAALHIDVLALVLSVRSGTILTAIWSHVAYHDTSTMACAYPLIDPLRCRG